MAPSSSKDVTSKKGRSKKQTLLELAMTAIRQQPPSAKGVSRVAIAKYMKDELGWENGSTKKLNQSLQKAVDSGKLVQTGQSFRVAGDPVPETPAEVNVKIEDVSVGKDTAEAQSGDHVSMKYEGKLVDGTVFDSASKFVFQIDAGEVIKGWDIGVKGMKVGGTRRLEVPAKLGYGKRGSPPDIPPNADLFFTVTLNKIISK